MSIFKSNDDEEKKRRRGKKFYNFTVVSPSLTPREIIGDEKRFKPFFRTINGTTIKEITPRSQEYRRRGLEGTAYENFNPNTEQNKTGMEFFRTQTKIEGGPGIARRREQTDDYVTYIQTGNNGKQKESHNGMKSFNNIIGNTSTSRKKKKNFWE